jgi:hypothetical protein
MVGSRVVEWNLRLAAYPWIVLRFSTELAQRSNSFLSVLGRQTFQHRLTRYVCFLALVIGICERFVLATAGLLQRYLHSRGDNHP